MKIVSLLINHRAGTDEKSLKLARETTGRTRLARDGGIGNEAVGCAERKVIFFGHSNIATIHSFCERQRLKKSASRGGIR